MHQSHVGLGHDRHKRTKQLCPVVTRAPKSIGGTETVEEGPQNQILRIPSLGSLKAAWEGCDWIAQLYIQAV